MTNNLPHITVKLFYENIPCNKDKSDLFKFSNYIRYIETFDSVSMEIRPHLKKQPI